ncbi:MAG: GIY-YIG nuclease family protein [Bdellovibrionota bacterium]
MTSKNSWRLYILRCADGTLYTGVTNDLKARVGAHNAGKGAKYTRGRGPVKLLHSEHCKDRGAALRREWEVKKLSRTEKLALGRRKKSGGSTR